jgi:hypothetical protein
MAGELELIFATGLPQGAFTPDALIDFVRRYEPGWATA